QRGPLPPPAPRRSLPSVLPPPRAPGLSAVSPPARPLPAPLPPPRLSPPPFTPGAMGSQAAPYAVVPVAARPPAQAASAHTSGFVPVDRTMEMPKFVVAPRIEVDTPPPPALSAPPPLVAAPAMVASAPAEGMPPLVVRYLLVCGVITML